MTAPGGPLATGHVDVRADLRQFDEDLRRKVEASLNRVGRTGRRQFRSIQDAAESAGAGIADAMRDAARSAERSAHRMSDAWCDAAAKAKRCVESLCNTDCDLERISRNAEKVKRSMSGLGAGRGLGSLAAGLARTTTKVLLYATAAGIAALATKALGVAIIQIAAALAPMVGLVVALPAALFAAAAAVGTALLAVRGFSDVLTALGEHDLDKFNEAIAKLSPNARAFAQELRGLLPHFEELRAAVQDAFFAGLSEELYDVAENLLPTIRAGLVDMAAVFNAGLKDLGEGLSTDAARSDIDSILQSAARAAEHLAGAIRPAVEALLEVGVVGGPVIERIAAAIGVLAEKFAAWVTDASASGELAQILNDAVDAAVLFGRILGDLLGIVVSVFEAGEDTGGGMLQTLEKITSAANDFFASAEGQETLTNLFASIAEVSGPVLELLRVAAHIIGDDLAPLLSELATNAAPGLTDLLRGLGEGLQALLPAAGPVGEAIGAVATALAPLLPLIGEVASVGLRGLAGGLEIVAAVLGPLVDSLAGPLGDAVAELGPLIDELARSFIPLAEQAGQFIRQALEPLAEKLPELTRAFVEELLPRLPELTDAFYQLLLVAAELAPIIADWLTDNLDELAPLLPVLADAAVDTALALADIARELAPLVSLFVQWVLANDTSTGSIKTVLYMLDFLTSAVRDTAWAVRQWVDDLRFAVGGLLALSDGITDAYNKMKGFLGWDWLPEVEKWNAEGRRLAEEFANGISLNTPEAERRARELREAAERGISGLKLRVEGVIPFKQSAADLAKLGLGVAGKLDTTNRRPTPGRGLPDRADLLRSEKAAKEAERLRDALAKAAEFLADGFVAGLLGSTDQMVATLKKMGELAIDVLGKQAASKLIASWADERDKLIGFAKGLERTADQLTAAQRKLDDVLGQSSQLATAVAEKVRGAFDLVPESGTRSINSLLRQMTKAVTTAQRFTRDFAKLKARGLSEALLGQLADAGPIAGARMAAKLAAADASQLRALNSMSAKLEGAATAAGGTVADAMFGAGIQAARGLVAGLQSEQAQIEAAMMRIARSMQAAIRKALGIKSPSTVMKTIAGLAMDGLRVGILAAVAGIDAAMTEVAARISQPVAAPTLGALASVHPIRGVNPASGALTGPRGAFGGADASTGGRSGPLIENLNLHMPTDDPEAAAQTVVNRIAAKVA